MKYITLFIQAIPALLFLAVATIATAVNIYALILKNEYWFRCTAIIAIICVAGAFWCSSFEGERKNEEEKELK